MRWMTWLHNRNVWLAAAALAMGACAYLLAQRYLRGQESAVQQRLIGQFANRDVLVAQSNLPAGTALEARMLAQRAVPERFLASDAFGAVAAAAVLGRKLNRTLQSGETVTASALAPVASPALSSLVEPGLRALTIPVDESSSAAGLMSPGDLIDLLFIRHADEDSSRPPMVRPLLQAVRVVATGQQMQRRAAVADSSAGMGEAGVPSVESSYSTVTLHVHPEDAERILLAQRLGELALILRPSGDTESASLPAVDAATLFGARETTAQAQRQARPGVANIEFIIGGVGAAARLRNAAIRPARRVLP